MLNTVKRILKYYIFWWNKIKYFFLIFFSLIIFWVAIFEPFFMKELIYNLEEYIKTWNYSSSIVFNIFMFWWIFIIFITLSRWFINYFLNQLMLWSYNEIYENNAKKLINMSYWDYLDKRQWETYKIFDRWMEWGFMLTENIIIRYLESIISIFVIIVVLFYVDYRMAIATLSMVPIMFLIGIFINWKTLSKQKKVNDVRDDAFWVLWDWISNLPLVKTLTLEKNILSRLSKKLYKWYLLQTRVTLWWTLWDIYIGFLVMVSRFLVLSLWIYFLINWSLSFATLFLFFSYIGYIYYPLGYLFNSSKQIQKQITWIEKFFDLVDTLNMDCIDDNNTKSTYFDISWNIEFKDVSFSYNKWVWILNNLNLRIKSWEKVALVGNTWSWKSTITNLLFRFWDINNWEILIDNFNIKNLTKRYIRKNIWIVMQDNSLFNTTIRKNLEYAKPWATENEIKDALKKSEANFVLNLKEWLDTVIWERWLKLSWWQKQRLNIARLFLKNPKILILDEATSALDNKTEKIVQKALDNLMKGRTSIIIAHRLSTIQNVDRILVIKKWSIIESWTYNELLIKKWEFFKLANPDNTYI